MPIYSNIKTTDVKDKLQNMQNMGCKLYNKGQKFHSGCLVDIQKPFKAGSKEYPAGQYKIDNIRSNGQIEIENNCGIKILTSATYLAQAGFKKVESK